MRSHAGVSLVRATERDVARSKALGFVSFFTVVLCVSGCGGAESDSSAALPTPTSVTSSAPNTSGTTPTASVTMTAVQGTVVEVLGNPLSGVTIEITDGALASTTTITDATGKFSFSQEAALPVTLRLTRDGYKPRTVVVQEKLPGDPFRLEALEAIQLSPGNYTLRFSLDPATAKSWIPQAPCAGIPADALTQQFNAAVARTGGTALGADVMRVTVTGEGLAFPSVFLAVAGPREGAVSWDTIVPIDKDLGNFRRLQISGTDYWLPGPVSSSASAVSIFNPVNLMYCRSSGTTGFANDCQQVPSNQLVEFHACTWDRAELRFERQ